MEAPAFKTKEPGAPATSWYWRRGHEQGGPLTREELSERVAADDLVWTADFPEWVAAGAVRGLLPARGHALTVPSDALPLVVLAGLIICFIVYFARATPVASLEAKALPEVEAAGDATYAVEICNNTAEARLYTAVAYFDPLRHDWVARGWFAHDRGACQVAIKNLRAPIYVYAETKDGSSRWSDDNGREFCLQSRAAFVVEQEDCPGGGAGLTKRKFKLLNVNGRGGIHTWDLSE